MCPSWSATSARPRSTAWSLAGCRSTRRARPCSAGPCTTPPPSSASWPPARGVPRTGAGCGPATHRGRSIRCTGTGTDSGFRAWEREPGAADPISAGRADGEVVPVDLHRGVHGVGPCLQAGDAVPELGGALDVQDVRSAEAHRQVRRLRGVVDADAFQGELLARGKAHCVALGQDLDVLLKAARMDVVGQAADADQLLAVVHDTQPDVVLLDIRMPPTHTLEGLRAAREIRSAYVARVGIVLLT